MPKTSASKEPYHELVHKLIKSTTEDEIMSTIKHFMENHAIYHDTIIDHYAEQNRPTIQKLYFNAIKRFNDAMRYNKNASQSDDPLHKDTMVAMAEDLVMDAEELLEQYNYFKEALGNEFMPNNDNRTIKELADAYLHSLIETLPLSDYQLFRLAYHHPKALKNQTPANKVADKVMLAFNNNAPSPLTIILHHIYLLINAMTEMKVNFLIGNHTLPTSAIDEIYAGLKHHKDEQKQLSFFKKKSMEMHTRELSLHTYIEAIKQLDKEIKELEAAIKSRVASSNSDTITGQLVNLSKELLQTHEKLQREKAEITAFHYKK